MSEVWVMCDPSKSIFGVKKDDFHLTQKLTLLVSPLPLGLGGGTAYVGVRIQILVRISRRISVRIPDSKVFGPISSTKTS